jgi:glycosyltransferase involved in cell wall biosynthesis
LRILALEPYYGGSHRAFLDGWSHHSRHRWTLLTLPPHHWKWRMRHSGATLAREVTERVGAGNALDGKAPWDLVFATSMLPLTDFRALVPPAVNQLPMVLYFHENQLTYPTQPGQEDARDVHFPLSQLVSALAAEAVWFNSAYHRHSFLEALPHLLAGMPDGQLAEAPEIIRERSAVETPGVPAAPPREGPRLPGPLRLLWAARWEHDKNPEGLFEALYRLTERGIDFRIDVLGQSFRKVPPIFLEARERLAGRIGRWGFLEHSEPYRTALGEADVFLSTAHHEFFGISAAEALAAGCFPLLPDRLAYPELLAQIPAELRRDCLYRDGELVDRLAALAERTADGSPWPPGAPHPGRQAVRHLSWEHRATAMDDALDRVFAAQAPR